MVGIAQLVSASDCGSEGPGFESLYPPSDMRNGLNVIAHIVYWHYAHAGNSLAGHMIIEYWAIAKG